jgi:universal stress protein E
MGQYQRFLLIADQNLHQSPAQLRAVALAKAAGAVLDVRAFVEPAPVVHLWQEKVDDAEQQRYLRRYRRWEAEELDRLSDLGLQVTVKAVFTTHALLDILKTVEDLKPDLLIKDVTLEPVLKRVFITPLDCHLLRECPIPVHLVNHVRYSLPHRIVAAVDPFDPSTQLSGLNDTIIQTANALALHCDAPLHLLYAYDLSPAFNSDAPLAGGGWGVDLSEELRQSLHQAFVALAERHGVPPERRHFVMGLPVPVISEFVEQYLADVVVMGTAHRVGLDRLIGSNTERALYSVPGSLLVVRSRARE